MNEISVGEVLRVFFCLRPPLEGVSQDSLSTVTKVRWPWCFLSWWACPSPVTQWHFPSTEEIGERDWLCRILWLKFPLGTDPGLASPAPIITLTISGEKAKLTQDHRLGACRTGGDAYYGLPSPLRANTKGMTLDKLLHTYLELARMSLWTQNYL